ncbi:TetR/AcrR family transcriptional regulator [Ammoniphilus sp. 3BR4]|uniref:TetR/AcrR family transcriptional regulator n=1 Tax=Ammoniphilus sp. 3BR4 TaxID=3158265 RepID=UPI00346562C1
MTRTVKKPEERRWELIQAATELFSEQGYEKTSVNDIILKIGVAKGTFYHYFKSKEEIADAVIQVQIEESIPLFQEIAGRKGEPALNKFLQVTEAFLQKAAKNYQSGLMKVLHHERNSLYHQRLKIQMIKDYVPIMAGIVEQGVQEGCFHTSYPEQVTEFLLAGMHFMLDPSLFSCSKEQFTEKVRAVGEIYEKMLGAAPGSFSAVTPYFAGLEYRP